MAVSGKQTCLPHPSSQGPEETSKVPVSLRGARQTILRRRIGLGPRELASELSEVASNFTHIHAGVFSDLPD